MKPLRAIVTRDRALARSEKVLAEATTVLVVTQCGARVGFHVPAQKDQTAKNAPRAKSAAFVASVSEELSPGKKPESSSCGRGRG